MLEEGLVEVTYSRTEKIGLPNWSFISLMASAKVAVPREHYDVVYDWLFHEVEAFLQARTRVVAEQLNIWAGIDVSGPDPDVDHWEFPITGVDLIEITFSRVETVGLPEKSSINLLSSQKMLVKHDAIEHSFDILADLVGNQMKDKRDVVLANPRPWTNQG